jgi:hypothetical protein
MAKPKVRGPRAHIDRAQLHTAPSSDYRVESIFLQNEQNERPNTSPNVDRKLPEKKTSISAGGAQAAPLPPLRPFVYDRSSNGPVVGLRKPLAKPQKMLDADIAVLEDMENTLKDLSKWQTERSKALVALKLKYNTESDIAEGPVSLDEISEGSEALDIELARLRAQRQKIESASITKVMFHPRPSVCPLEANQLESLRQQRDAIPSNQLELLKRDLLDLHAQDLLLDMNPSSNQGHLQEAQPSVELAGCSALESQLCDYGSELDLVLARLDAADSESKTSRKHYGEDGVGDDGKMLEDGKTNSNTSATGSGDCEKGTTFLTADIGEA